MDGHNMPIGSQVCNITKARLSPFRPAIRGLAQIFGQPAEYFQYRKTQTLGTMVHIVETRILVFNSRGTAMGKISELIRQIPSSGAAPIAAPGNAACTQVTEAVAQSPVLRTGDAGKRQ